MFASMERKIIDKNYDEYINYKNQNNVWTYLNKDDAIEQITLDYNKDINKYIFSFPMKTGNINYTSYFDSYSDVLIYMHFVVNEYL
jgi:hypothetical protein